MNVRQRALIISASLRTIDRKVGSINAREQYFQEAVPGSDQDMIKGRYSLGGIVTWSKTVDGGMDKIFARRFSKNTQ